MTEIDWSKITSDAEFAGTLKGNQRPVFYKNVTETSYEYHYPDEGGWSGMAFGQPMCPPLIPRQAQAWDGEGLPPVGRVCEVKSIGRGVERDWFKASVLYSSTYTMVFDDYQAGEFVAHPATLQFRPIRTSAQIAADERSAAIATACLVVGEKAGMWNCSTCCSAAMRATVEALYDAGLLLKEKNDG